MSDAWGVLPTCCFQSSHQNFKVFFFFFFFFFFFRAKPVAYEAPRLGVFLELQLPAYTTATAMQNPSHFCNLHYSSHQQRILKPLSKAGDQTCNLMDTIGFVSAEPWQKLQNFKVFYVTFSLRRNHHWSLIICQVDLETWNSPNYIGDQRLESNSDTQLCLIVEFLAMLGSYLFLLDLFSFFLGDFLCV